MLGRPHGGGELLDSLVEMEKSFAEEMKLDEEIIGMAESNKRVARSRWQVFRPSIKKLRDTVMMPSWCQNEHYHK